MISNRVLLSDLNFDLDEFLLANNHALFYQSEQYLRLLQDYLDCEMYCFNWVENDEILAVLPMAI